MIVKSGQGDYPVVFAETVQSAVRELKSIPGAVLLIDAKVARLYGKALGPLLRSWPVIKVEAAEATKTLAGASAVLTRLQDFGCDRRSVLVAVGGGIIQDLATFVAHVYYRGIRWAYLPTTLLGMSDSCIGAKAAVNHGRFKNQLGVFHSPAKVVICARFADTLSDADLASGYGEILKLALAGSAARFERLRRTVERSGLRNAELKRLIRESLAVKKAVIEKDEYDAGLRRTLNYGHTFGHALESLSGYRVPHGLAVAWGLDLANWIALKRGRLSEENFLTIHHFVRRHLSCRLPGRLRAAPLLAAAGRDKKAAGGRVNMILLERPGRLRMERIALDSRLETEVQGYLDRFCRSGFEVANCDLKVLGP